MSLIKVRDDVKGRKTLGSEWEATLRAMQADIGGLVNSYFEERLRAIPEVNEYIDMLA